MRVPEGWKNISLEKIVVPKIGLKRGPFGGSLKKEIFVKSGYMVYEQRNAIYNDFLSVRYYIDEEKYRELEDFSVEKGDFIVSCSGTIGCIARVPEQLKKGVINQALMRIRLSEAIDPVFFINVFRSEPFQKIIVDNTQGGAMKNMIGMSEFKKIKILLPPIHDQKKIAQILSTWDKAIEKLETLIVAKQKRKKALMQQLLTGKRRFAQYIKSDAKQSTKFGEIPADWEYLHIGDVAKQISLKNNGGHDLPVLSCTKHYGLVDSLAYFGKRIFSEDTSTYKIAPRNAFAYATNHIEEGSIGYQNLYDEALISPMYTVFQTKNNIDDSYLYRLLKTELYRHIFEVNTSASVDRRGSLRWNEFAHIKIPVPSIEEQQKIADVLSIADKEIVTHQNHLSLLKQQKKGLMQQLLTGKKRVQVELAEEEVA